MNIFHHRPSEEKVSAGKNPGLWILIIPFFAFLSASVTLDLASFLPSYPDCDLSGYMAARSLGEDFDLAYTQKDVDRFFRTHLYQPSRFVVVQKKILASDGQYRTYPAFYAPSLHPFLLAPFVRFWNFYGLLLFHTLLVGVLYWCCYGFYIRNGSDSILSSLNAVVYFTLFPVPLLFLLPSTQLFFLAACTAAVFFGLTKRMVRAALSLALAFSVQPWALLLALFLVGYWQFSGLKSEAMRYGFFLFLFCLFVHGIEMLIYPATLVSQPVWVVNPPSGSLLDQWDKLPLWEQKYWTTPDFQRLADFLFGRNIGFLAYGIAPAALFFSSLPLWRDRIVNRALLTAFLSLILVSLSDPSSWNRTLFSTDWLLILGSLAPFLAPLVRPAGVLITTVILSGIFVGPLLINPMGAITSRVYYLQSFPYSFLPVELSMLQETTLPGNTAFQMSIPGGKIYFLNDQFYQEGDFFWVRGEGTVSFLLEMDQNPFGVYLNIQNGSMENEVFVRWGKREEHFYFRNQEQATLDSSVFEKQAKLYGGKYYLHGKIKSNSGYIPKLLSRDNIDYRYLGCRVQFIKKNLKF